MSSVRQIDTLLTAATQSILLQITWSEAFKVRSAIMTCFCSCHFVIVIIIVLWLVSRVGLGM